VIASFRLPYPPSVNHYWRHVGSVTKISRKGRAYREKVCSILSAVGAEPIPGPLAVDVQAFPPDRRKHDLDNILKALFDALEKGGAYHDDNQIMKLTAEKHEPVKGGQVVVKIESFEGNRT